MLAMRSAAIALVPLAALLVAGCTRHSGNDTLLPQPSGSALPAISEEPSAPAFEQPSLPAPVTPRASAPVAASPTGFPESTVTACNGHPSAAQVISVVRKQPELLPSGANVSASTGPMCSGTWQWTVLNVPDHEPLQVVTKGAPGALTFVTAGTNVCTVDVRAGAPVALLTQADC
jgi:hypothetical protein